MAYVEREKITLWRLGPDGPMSQRPGLSPLGKLVCEAMEEAGHNYRSLAPLLGRVPMSLYTILSEMYNPISLNRANAILDVLGYDIGFTVTKRE